MISVNGTIKELTGQVDVAATIIFELQGYGSWLPIVADGVIATTKINAPITDGTFQVDLYGNDAIQPSGTYYLVTVLSDSGQRISAPYQFIGAGRVDLDSQMPLLTAPTDISPISKIDCSQGFTVQLKRGPVASLPHLADGEAYFAIDTNALYLGDGGTNVQVSASQQLPTFIVGETPFGVINGVNKSFTLAHAPSASSLAVYLNGIRQSPSTYTLNGSIFTLLVAPSIGDDLHVDYRY